MSKVYVEPASMPMEDKPSAGRRRDADVAQQAAKDQAEGHSREAFWRVAPSPGSAMSLDVWEFATGAGSVLLRSQEVGDEAFLAALFAANHAGLLRDAGLPQSTIDHLVGMQHRSQSQTYRSLYPHARYSIVECDGLPIGRLVTHEEAAAISIVDIALLPSVQGRGIGRASIATMLGEAARLGRGARAMVMVSNRPSLAMFRRLGFQETACCDAVHVTLRWTPPTLATTA